MGKGHRDNHKARKKRGPVAFKKKAKRRSEIRVKCNICGTRSRKETLDGGLCPPCRGPEKKSLHALETACYLEGRGNLMNDLNHTVLPAPALAIALDGLGMGGRGSSLSSTSSSSRRA